MCSSDLPASSDAIALPALRSDSESESLFQIRYPSTPILATSTADAVNSGPHSLPQVLELLRVVLDLPSVDSVRQALASIHDEQEFRALSEASGVPSTSLRIACVSSRGWMARTGTSTSDAPQDPTPAHLPPLDCDDNLLGRFVRRWVLQEHASFLFTNDFFGPARPKTFPQILEELCRELRHASIPSHADARVQIGRAHV